MVDIANVTKGSSRAVVGTHEIYCCGSRVRISEDGVNVLSEPQVAYCPLHESLYGTRRIDRDAVRKSVQMKIDGQGFCCKNRTFGAEPVVAYGASEMMHVWLENELIDCAVLVCEGAGTVVTTNGKLAQAIGARLTGIIRTSPVREIIEQIEARDGIILDKDSARINQIEGVKRAFEIGHKRIAVSVAGFQSKAITEIRNLEAKARIDVLIFSVCNTCARDEDLRHIAKADIVCASASKILRNEISRKALLQLGVTIPVYALTQRAKKLVLAYLDSFEEKLVIFKTRSLPYQVEGKGPRLKLSQADQKP